MQHLRTFGVMVIVLGSVSSCAFTVLPPLMADHLRAQDLRSFLPSTLAILGVGVALFALGHIDPRFRRHRP